MGGDLRRRGAGLMAIGFLLATGVLGCASNPPCVTPVTEVQAAQDAAAAKDRELQSVRSERQRLEAQIRQKEARLAELQSQPEELTERIEVLEKGSGR